MGQFAPARGAGARQYRVDGGLGQDDGAEDRRQEPPDPAQECCRPERRRLRLDRSLRQGRQRRPGQLQPDLGALGRRHRYVLGRCQRHLQHERQLGHAELAAKQLHQARDLLQVGLHHAKHLHRAGKLLPVELYVAEQLHCRGQLLPLELYVAEHVQGRGHLLHLRLFVPELVHRRRNLLQPGSDDAERLHVAECLHEIDLHQLEQLHQEWRNLGQRHLDCGHLDRGDLDDGDLDAGHLDARDLDAQRAHHLDRLRDGPRPKQRHDQRRADDERHHDAVPGRAVQPLLPRDADGAQLRLDLTEQQGRCHDAKWRHQPGRGLAVGIPVIDGFPVHHPVHGFKLQIPEGHHPADGRPEHAGSLVRGWCEPVASGRRPPEDSVRQRQRCRHHALHRAGQHRRLPHVDTVAELRGHGQRSDADSQSEGLSGLEQVLPADLRERDHHDVPADRDRPVLPAGREIGQAREQAPQTNKARPDGRAFSFPRTRAAITSPKRPCRTGSRTACRLPWRDRHRARRAWWPRRRSPRSST